MNDLEKLLDEFLELTRKKRNQINESPSKTPTIPPSDERLEKEFIGFFMNKLLDFYEKLTNLINELISLSSIKNNKEESNESFFFRAFKSTRRKESFTRSNSKSSEKLTNSSMSSRTDECHRNSIKLIHSLQIKINQLLKNSKNFKKFVDLINYGSGQQFNESMESLTENDFDQLQGQTDAIKSSLNQLFFELFIDKISDTNFNLKLKKKLHQMEIPTDLSNFLFKSTRLLEDITKTFKEHLFHYTPYLDMKLKCNLTMSYWHNLQGLVHFSFINRQSNICLVPNIEASATKTITQKAIYQAYRKYMPLINNLVFKNECNKFYFTDDKLKIFISYTIWFEDRNFNYIPADFNYQQLPLNDDSNSNMNALNNGLESMNFASRSFQPKDTQNRSYIPGITYSNFYEQLKTICYPNAPAESLTCYELFCIQSLEQSERTLRTNFKFLVLNLSKMLRNY